MKDYRKIAQNKLIEARNEIGYDMLLSLLRRHNIRIAKATVSAICNKGQVSGLTTSIKNIKALNKRKELI